MTISEEKPQLCTLFVFEETEVENDFQKHLKFITDIVNNK